MFWVGLITVEQERKESMIKIIFTFFAVFLFFFFGFSHLRSMTKKDKWQLTKLVAYSILCASLTMLTISFIVLIF